MAHTHSVIDDDLRFVIDPSTREIGNGSQKVKLIQYDHNSEQFTFEIPRFIEGHDMSLCNSIRVNYININKSTREQNPGVYEVIDTKVEEDNIIFSWLVSRNATQYVGPLNFLIKFMCFDEDDNVIYEWHTDIFKNASVSTGMNIEESIEEVYPDILEKWKNDVLAAEESRITAESERVTAESERVNAESARANTFAGYETEINRFKNEIVTGKDSATDNTKFAIGAAEQNLEVPSMEEFNELKSDKLDKTGTAADSDKLGGQLPEHYATAQSVNQLEGDVAAITPDDTVVDGKPWTSKKTIDSLCMPIEATGNPAQVYPVEGYPLGVKVSLEPVQEGSGDPSPDNIRPITGRDAVRVTRCGKNLLPKAVAGSQTSGDITVTSNGDGSYTVKGTTTGSIPIQFAIEVPITIPVGTYLHLSNTGTITSYVAFVLHFTDGTDVGITFNVEKRVWKISDGYIGKTINAIGIYVNGVQTVDVTLKPMICMDATTGEFEPYQGNTYTAEFGQTVYGGTLDLESGVVTVNKRITIADGTVNKFNPDATGKYWNMPINSSPGINNKITIQCSHFDGKLLYTNKAYDFIFTTNTTIAGLFNTADELNAYLVEQNAAGTPVTFVYELKTPYTIQLAPQQIAELSGVNTLYTDAGTLTVTGREDPQHTIVELKNAIISLGGNI